MKNYQSILEKIKQFVRKYYVNELIRGSILFLTLGLLYFLFTLYLEYFLWLKPQGRTALFVIFIAVELFLLYRYILTPISKLMGLRKGLDHSSASKIIGDYFPEIDDKLLNTLQLHEQGSTSELVLASIEQKAQQLKVFPFKQAVNFKVNTKYLKYLALPVLIYLLTLVSGRKHDLNKSYDRLTHPQMAYTPPAPYSFVLEHNNLQVVEGQDYQLNLHIEGKTVPKDVYIDINGQTYFMQKESVSDFKYVFKNVTKNQTFSLSADPVSMDNLQLKVIPTPKIQNLEMLLNFPKYTGKRARVIKNTGNTTVPEGTNITWRVNTQAADSLFYQSNGLRLPFTKTDQSFKKTKSLRQSTAYTIAASNAYLQDYEKLNFNIKVIKDELPKMIIQTDIDSIPFGEAHFAGRLSDDYGLKKLNLVYYKTNNAASKQIKPISISTSQLSDFILTFPGDIPLEQSENYSLYFEVFDNDAVNGYKSVKSREYTYYKPSEVELDQMLLDSQSKQLDDLQDQLKKQTNNQKQLDQLEQQLKNTPQIDFNTEQELKDAIQRHEKYQLMMQQKLQKLNEQFQDQEKENSLKEKHQDIEKRIEETLQNKQEQKLMDELKELSKKLDKESLMKKLQQMNSHAKYREKSLKELLELTKRFYVEQQLQHLAEALKNQAKEQESLKNDPNNSAEKQKQQSKAFDDLKEQINQMMKSNEDLQDPLSIDPEEQMQDQVQKAQEDAQKQLNENQKKSAQSNQSKAAQKMQQMAQAFQQQLQEMQDNSIHEDIATIRRLLDNLLIFSFKQEDLLSKLKSTAQIDLNFADNLKEQYVLQTYFQHIDDSLYTLSMRQPKLSKNINNYLESAHYNLKQSINTMEDSDPKAFNTNTTRAHQQYVMTASNDLAYLLNSLLDNLQQSLSSGSSQGSKEKKPGFSLPDIIKQQSGMCNSIQKKMGEKGEPKQEGQSNKPTKSESEQESEEVFELYKQQSKLRQELDNQLDNINNPKDNKAATDLVKQMKQLENMLLEKGITNELQAKVQQIQQQLLKLKNATYSQQEDQQREAKTNKKKYPNTSSDFYKKFLKQVSKEEILNKNPLPFQSDINVKINQYFKTEKP